MSLQTWWRGMCYSGYDWGGNLKYLLGRAHDPMQCDIDGIPSKIRDEALALLCESFNIPERQKHCLRPSDELMAIYRNIVGPRSWDSMEFECLGLSLGKLPVGKVDPKEFHERVKTVADLIRFTAERRGITRQCNGPEPRV